MKSIRGASPLRYPGGKQRALSQIDALLPASVDEFREPFFGGGSVAFHVSRRFPGASVWVNDAHGPLIDFWTCLQDPDGAAAVVAALREVHAQTQTALKGKRRFLAAVEELAEPGRDQVRNAVLFYFYNRCSFSGASGTGFVLENWERWAKGGVARIANLTDWTPKMSGWRITRGDYRPVMDEPFSGSNSFCFADPPYDIAACCLYGPNKGDLHRGFDHQAFRMVAEASDASVMVTYNSELISHFADWPIRRLWNLRYTMVSRGRYRIEQRKRKEMIATNYPVPRIAVPISDAPPDAAPHALRKLLASLGLTQREAARALGVSDRAVRYWLSGERPVSGPALAALRLMTSRC